MQVQDRIAEIMIAKFLGNLIQIADLLLVAGAVYNICTDHSAGRLRPLRANRILMAFRVFPWIIGREILLQVRVGWQIAFCDDPFARLTNCDAFKVIRPMIDR